MGMSDLKGRLEALADCWQREANTLMTAKQTGASWRNSQHVSELRAALLVGEEPQQEDRYYALRDAVTMYAGDGVISEDAVVNMAIEHATIAQGPRVGEEPAADQRKSLYNVKEWADKVGGLSDRLLALYEACRDIGPIRQDLHLLYADANNAIMDAVYQRQVQEPAADPSRNFFQIAHEVESRSPDGDGRPKLKARTSEGLNGHSGPSIAGSEPADSHQRKVQERAADPWHPIATAPKDGTHLLVCDAHKPYTAFWGFGQNPPTVGHYFEPGWHLSVNFDGEHSEIQPTHWMPLPAPPGAASQQQEPLKKSAPNFNDPQSVKDPGRFALLALYGARMSHEWFFDKAANIDEEPPEGHENHGRMDGDPFGFNTCPHPDCVMVRGAASPHWQEKLATEQENIARVAPGATTPPTGSIAHTANVLTEALHDEGHQPRRRNMRREWVCSDCQREGFVFIQPTDTAETQVRRRAQSHRAQVKWDRKADRCAGEALRWQDAASPRVHQGEKDDEDSLTRGDGS